jgi:cold shock CspA family protein
MNAEILTGERAVGTISTYVADRGWGYISRPTELRVEKFFFHVSQFRSKDTKPALGVAVSFSISPVIEGKWPTALDVTPIQ